MMLDKSSAVASIILSIIKEKVRALADLMVGLLIFLYLMNLCRLDLQKLYEPLELKTSDSFLINTCCRVYEHINTFLEK